MTDYIDVYFASEVLIHGPDVWIGKKGSDLIQNPDDKIFYEYQNPRARIQYLKMEF